MSTVRLFDDNSYLREFTATVTACQPHGDGFAVALDQTAFVPEGGGQKGDSGYLGEVRVRHTEEDNGIWHLTDAPLTVGDSVCGRIDWEPRWYRMQHHSGEHVLSGLVTQQYGFRNVGFHIGDTLVTIDYDGVLSREQLDALENEANAVICENRAITAYYPNEEQLEELAYRSKKEITTALRIVEVEGIDVCACCAPHVAKTGEIGILKITDVKHYKGGVRLQLICGAAAVRDYQQKQAITTHINNFLSSVQEKTITAFDTYTASVDAADAAWEQRALQLVQELATATPHTDGLPILVSSATGELARALAETAAQRGNGSCLVLGGNDTDGYRYTLYSQSTALPALVKEANAALNGKGGGKPPFAAGFYGATKEEIEHWFSHNPIATP